MSNQPKPVSESLGASAPNAPIWVKLLVFFHVLCVLIWTIPRPPAEISEGRAQPTLTGWIPYLNEKHLKTLAPVRGYLFTTGMWQYWDMFAPNPSNVDIYGTAEVVRRDGTVTNYDYPRVYKMSIPAKVPGERYRKFYERAQSEDYRYMWRRFAQTIAERHADPTNPPVSVRLYRHFLRIAPPGKPQQQDYTKYMYYEYIVEAKR